MVGEFDERATRPGRSWRGGSRLEGWSPVWPVPPGQHEDSEHYAARGEREGNSKTEASFLAQRNMEVRKSKRDKETQVPLHLRGQMKFSLKEVAAKQSKRRAASSEREACEVGRPSTEVEQPDTGVAPGAGGEELSGEKKACTRCKVIIWEVTDRIFCSRCVEEEASGRGWRDPVAKFMAGRSALESKACRRGWKEVAGEGSQEWATEDERAWSVASKRPKGVIANRARASRRAKREETPGAVSVRAR
jgi:ribosomal protein S27AE